MGRREIWDAIDLVLFFVRLGNRLRLGGAIEIQGLDAFWGWGIF
jgi:hypothetical protein